MIGSGATLSVKHPCELLEVSRSNDYRSLRPRSVTDRALRDAIAGIYEQHPFYGKWRVQVELSKQGLEAGVRRIRNRMREMHLEPIRPKPRTSVSSRAHEKYPYLLRNRKIVRSDEVGASDIPYIPMRRGYVYLTSVIDWHSRKVLSWRLSNSLDSRFCVEALKEALVRYGKPTIFHTDQGSQYTSDSFLDVLRAAEVAISMDGKGRWRDNVRADERLWRSVKYESVHLHAWNDPKEARQGIGRWVEFYNRERPHQALGYRTPDDVYWSDRKAWRNVA